MVVSLGKEKKKKEKKIHAGQLGLVKVLACGAKAHGFNFWSRADCRLNSWP